MMQKKIILIVDNRVSEQSASQPHKSAFRGSAFKATQIDPHQQNELLSDVFDEHTLISKLNQRITGLEQRVEQLEKNNKCQKIRKRIRRKANQICREYQCNHKGCQKYYGSETSLKNHLKLKHGQKNDGPFN